MKSRAAKPAPAPAAWPPARDPAGKPPAEEFEEFYRDNIKAVLLFCHRYRSLDVENIVAEAFARAYARWPELTHPRPYVFTTVINLARDAGKEGQRTGVSGDPYADHENRIAWRSGTLLPGAEWNIEVDEVSRALQQLPGQQRAAVLLASQKLEMDEIAAALNCRQVTARVHLHLGRARLRDLLGEPQPAKRQVSSTEGSTA